ncbi:Xaa-Pro peptidase family protein [Corynebacterium sp. TAE3-ERU2]|uniref:M24 family metallopeptidase n=1 Tax=Corynebacterium sp. TAE3-ERU2 TaxID=2849497 RepID=UPI001C452F2E|nr:Xaa-Pro peptidase family protein [Corynebacterium sp. TAE3-ERU2]MBV7302587.1 Xaa-Pro peptidase family protein [Corynebacterium sp. TAE3-ERU2]
MKKKVKAVVSIDYSARIARAQALIAEKGYAALVASPGREFRFFTGLGFDTHERLTALVIPAHGEPVVVIPEVDAHEAPASVTVRGWRDGQDPYGMVRAVFDDAASDAPLALSEQMPLAHAAHFMDRPIRGVDSAFPELSVVKEDIEIEWLAEAAAAIDAVHAQVPALLQEGVSERAIAEQLHTLILRAGHSTVDFVIVGSGPNGANPHHSFSDRRLQAGDIVVVDIGGTMPSGYHSDCTRTYAVGEIDADVAEMYSVLDRAQRTAIAAIAPGVRAADIDAAARDIIEAAGYGDAFFHRTGHGIGLEVHEQPFIIAGNDLVLQPGMCFSVEPGIYLRGRFGARIEDIVAVDDDGVRVLNTRPRNLYPDSSGAHPEDH